MIEFADSAMLFAIIMAGVVVAWLRSNWKAEREWEEEFRAVQGVRVEDRAAAIVAAHQRTPKKKVDETYPRKVRGANGSETRRARLAVQRSATGAALYAEVLKAPRGDLMPRMAMSDWLREQGFDGAADRMA